MNIRIEDYYQECEKELKNCSLNEQEMTIRNVNVFSTILKKLYLNGLDFTVSTKHNLTIIYIYKKDKYE